MEPNTLPANLRILCGHYRSVAEVCRLIGINRQQFNKYLGGTSQPSVRTLRRICDFFGVDETEIFLPPAELEPLVRIRAERPLKVSPLSGALDAIVERHPDSQERLERYCGYYAGFMRTPALPRMILRYLTVIHQSDGHTYAKTIERLAEGRSRSQTGARRLGTLVTKYLGLVLHGEDRIYLWEHGPHCHQSYALTVLYPTYRARLHLLTGLGVSVSGGPGRQAFSTRYVLEHLGASTDLRAAIRACGFYPEDSGEIDPAVRARLRNEIDREEGTLCALGF